jgi:toxin ParE1/3/4
LTESFKIVWTLNALEDLEQLRQYLMEQAGPEIMVSEATRIWESVNRLAHFPASGRPGRVPGTRELIVPPYILPYRVRDKRVEILDLFHPARDWEIRRA